MRGFGKEEIDEYLEDGYTMEDIDEIERLREEYFENCKEKIRGVKETEEYLKEGYSAKDIDKIRRLQESYLYGCEYLVCGSDYKQRCDELWGNYEEKLGEICAKHEKEKEGFIWKNYKEKIDDIYAKHEMEIDRIKERITRSGHEWDQYTGRELREIEEYLDKEYTMKDIEEIFRLKTEYAMKCEGIAKEWAIELYEKQSEGIVDQWAKGLSFGSNYKQQCDELWKSYEEKINDICVEYEMEKVGKEKQMTRNQAEEITEYLKKGYPMEDIDEIHRLQKEYLEECKEIAKECEDESYLSSGANFKKQCEELWSDYEEQINDIYAKHELEIEEIKKCIVKNDPDHDCEKYTGSELKEIKGYLDTGYSMEDINEIFQLKKEYLEECELIAEQCEEEGYPPCGENYELRCENLRKYYEEQIDDIHYKYLQYEEDLEL